MSFLDDLISENSYSENVNPGLFTRIEIMIWNSSLDEKQKERMTKRMRSITTDEGAYLMISELQESQPIVGLDRVPITQYEISKATRERADRDDFAERIKL